MCIRDRFEYDIADEAGTMAIGNATGGGWKYFYFHPDSTVFNHSGTASGTGVDVIKAALFASTTAEWPSSAGCLSNWDFVVSRATWADGTSDPDPCAASTGDTTGGDTTGGDTTGGDTTGGDTTGGDTTGGDPTGGDTTGGGTTGGYCTYPGPVDPISCMMLGGTWIPN